MHDGIGSNIQKREVRHALRAGISLMLLWPILLTLLLTGSEMIARAQTRVEGLPTVRREFRAAWIATVDNIDWPSKRTLSTEEQRAELIRLLDLAKDLKLNAVVSAVDRLGNESLPLTLRASK